MARGDSVAYSGAMRRERISGEPKGWFFGPWNSDLPVSVGFANAAIDEPHTHNRITEIYFVARGSCSVRVRSERNTRSGCSGEPLPCSRPALSRPAGTD